MKTITLPLEDYQDLVFKSEREDRLNDQFRDTILVVDKEWRTGTVEYKRIPGTWAIEEIEDEYEKIKRKVQNMEISLEENEIKNRDLIRDAWRSYHKMDEKHRKAISNLRWIVAGMCFLIFLVFISK